MWTLTAFNWNHNAKLCFWHYIFWIHYKYHSIIRIFFTLSPLLLVSGAYNFFWNNDTVRIVNYSNFQNCSSADFDFYGETTGCIGWEGEWARKSCMYVDTAALKPAKSTFVSTAFERPDASEKDCCAVCGTLWKNSLNCSVVFDRLNGTPIAFSMMLR